MGERQEKLKQIFNQIGFLATPGLSFPTSEILERSGFSHEIQRVYRELGGILDILQVNLRPWDIEVNGIAVELDEEFKW